MKKTKTVSYTHLDVYKRQGAICTVTRGNSGISLVGVWLDDHVRILCGE